MNKEIWLKEREISKLKQNLSATDYQAIKYAEGELTEEEYAETKAKRKAWREEINAKEAEIAAFKEEQATEVTA